MHSSSTPYTLNPTSARRSQGQHAARLAAAAAEVEATKKEAQATASDATAARQQAGAHAQTAAVRLGFMV